MPVELSAYDLVGLRVSDRDLAVKFYTELGLLLDEAYSNERVAEMVSPAGVRINLIFNGQTRSNNILLDEPQKWPG